ncbi:hypothetical protein ZWY2020_020884 [Hordeum vulgare]|nr:hypothetical protein ZWY2020_020884 [Hordeum vulgare]
MHGGGAESCPSCKAGMLTWPGRQGPVGFRQRVNKGNKERVIGLPKGASTGAPAYLPTQSSGGVRAASDSVTAGGTRLAVGVHIPSAAKSLTRSPWTPPRQSCLPLGRGKVAPRSLLSRGTHLASWNSRRGPALASLWNGRNGLPCRR